MGYRFRKLFEEYYPGLADDLDETEEEMLETCECRIASSQYHNLKTVDAELACYAGVVLAYVNDKIAEIGTGPQKPQRIRELQDKAVHWMAPYLVGSPRWMPNEEQEVRIQATLDFPAVVRWVEAELKRVAAWEKADGALKNVSTGGLVAVAAGLLGSIVGLPGSEFVLKAGVVATAGSQGARVYIKHKEVVDDACRSLKNKMMGNAHAQSVLDRIQYIKGT